MDWCKYTKILNFLNTVKRHWAIGNGAIGIDVIIIIIIIIIITRVGSCAKIIWSVKRFHTDFTAS